MSLRKRKYTTPNDNIQEVEYLLLSKLEDMPEKLLI